MPNTPFPATTTSSILVQSASAQESSNANAASSNNTANSISNQPASAIKTSRAASNNTATANNTSNNSAASSTIARNRITTIPCFLVVQCPTLHITFSGTGKGAVSLTNNISCRSDSGRPCSARYPPRTAVTITATPDSDSTTGTWGGDCPQPPAEGTVGIEPTFTPTPLNATITLDKDKTCNVTLNAKAKLTIQFAGQGFGMVRDFIGQIKCATGNVGKCILPVEPTRGTTISLNYLAMPFSTFGGISGQDCAIAAPGEIGPPILIDRDKTCTVTFNLDPSATLPSNVVHSISPEAVEAINDINLKNRTFLGWPVSEDNNQMQGYSHFQLLKTNDAYANSIEIQPTADDGSYCAYASYTPEKMPYWYDIYDAIDDPNRYAATAHREWAGVSPSPNLGQVQDKNWDPSTWPSTSSPFGQNGSPFPPGKGPTSQWFKECVNMLGNPVVPIPYQCGINATGMLQCIPGAYLPPLVDPVRYCNNIHDLDISSLNYLPFLGTLGAGILQYLEHTRGLLPLWCTLDPSDSNYDEPWVPHTATGIVTQAARSGVDLAFAHRDPEVAPNYWLGLTLPGQGSNPFWDSPNGCGTFSAEHDKCNDWVNSMWLDPQYRYLLSQTSSHTHPGLGNHGNMVTEIEQWLVPQGYRPDPGDRETVVGRWIVDHAEFWISGGDGGGAEGATNQHTELHPTEAVVSTFLQTGNLTRNEPRESFFWTTHECDNHNCVAPTTPDQTTMINVPFISDRWSKLTHGNPATVTKFVITSDWQGEDLTFDIYPPSRPSPDAKLHWEKENGTTLGSGVDVSYSLEPADNPNHLVVKVTSSGHVKTGINKGPVHINYDYGQVLPDPSRRVVNAYMLWWDNSS